MGLLSKPPKVFTADCFEDAYRKGMFVSTMSKDELLTKLRKVRSDFVVSHSGHTAQGKKLLGLYIKSKGEKTFVTGMTDFYSIPKHTLQMPNGHLMIKGWESIVKAVIAFDRKNERKYCEVFGY